jgi:hypothetical protein
VVFKKASVLVRLRATFSLSLSLSLSLKNPLVLKVNEKVKERLPCFWVIKRRM